MNKSTPNIPPMIVLDYSTAACIGEHIDNAYKRFDTSPIPRLGLSLDEAAQALGMSRDSLERHVLPSLRIVRRGRLRVVPVTEIERWLTTNADPAIPPRR